MDIKEQIKSRQECNIRIASILANHENNLVRGIARDFLELANQLPQQRAGQIICNYICADYRDPEPMNPTKVILEALFPGNPDPFFEESYVTLKRLTNGR